MTEAPTDSPPGRGARLGAYELLGVLGRGTSAVVHRARRVDSGTAAAVKQLHVADPADLEALRREIDLLGRLRHPGVVRVLGHGVDGGIPWYAMELVDGESLETRWAATPPAADPTTALRILARLCQTLAFLHGEGLVHRDLKPANVMVRPDGTPVLVDFGFAASFAGRTGREVLERGGEMIGSLAYMAPEQLRGEFVDARADLYALGCMLYEVLGGAPPFRGSAMEIARAQLEQPPPPLAISAGGAIGALAATVAALLAKSPRDRPGYAEDVARQIAAVLGEPPAPMATHYLYRAGFVGRDGPLAHLGACLERAAEGHALCALVQGESGVGKTRLAMEFTRLAASRRFDVVTGDCRPTAAAGDALEPLRPLLRRLADAARQSPAEATRLLAGRARVLAAIEPGLERAPGLETEPPPPALPAAAARDRLVNALVGALAEWARQAPLVVVLDDLQWADELTLAVLTALVDGALACPLMVLATVRSGEDLTALRPLAARPGIAAITLERVDRAAVGVIVGDMLAMRPAPPALVDFIADHCDGNPFFVSEYLRTAVGAGLLVRSPRGDWQPGSGARDAYARLGLPDTLRALLERRLRDLGVPTRALVEAAAVLGREFDPDLAAAMSRLDDAALTSALAELRARQVADAAAAGQWRFAHDQLREVAYAALDEARRRTLHGDAAATIESRPPTSGDRSRSVTLAHHFDAAGTPARAAPYHGLAGEQALADGALAAARAHLTVALQAAPAATADAVRAHWWRLIAEASAGDDLESAIGASREALQALGEWVPRGALGWAAAFGGQLARRVRPRPARDRAAASEAARAANRAAMSFYYGFEILPGITSSLRCVNLADAAGEPGRAALAYAQLGYVAGGARLHRLAARCFTRAHGLRDVAVDPTEFAAGLYFHAMYEMGFGRWAASRALAEEAAARLREIGNPEEAEVAETVLSNTLFYAGALRDAETCAAAVRASADARGHAQHGAWGQFLVGRSRLALGEIASARDGLERGYERLLPTRDFVSLVMCEGLLAKARWADGDPSGAAAAAAALESRLQQRRIVPLAQCLDGYGALADVRLRLWAARGDAASAAAARDATRWLRRFARLYPIAAPAAARATARYAWRRGQARRARRAWARSIRLAHQLDMPLDEALARLDCARVGGGAAERAQAAALLERLGCVATVAAREVCDA